MRETHRLPVLGQQGALCHQTRRRQEIVQFKEPDSAAWSRSGYSPVEWSTRRWNTTRVLLGRNGHGMWTADIPLRRAVDDYDGETILIQTLIGMPLARTHLRLVCEFESVVLMVSSSSIFDLLWWFTFGNPWVRVTCDDRRFAHCRFLFRVVTRG